MVAAYRTNVKISGHRAGAGLCLRLRPGHLLRISMKGHKSLTQAMANQLQMDVMFVSLQ